MRSKLNYLNSDPAVALKGLVNPDYIAQALDDDADGTADTGIWTAVGETVEADIDQRLAPSFSVPFTGTLPAVITRAAAVLAAEALYNRRARPDSVNPWAALAKEIRARLDRIGRGEEPLASGTPSASQGGAVIGEASKIYDEAGRLMT